jgi:hypothetical protein
MGRDSRGFIAIEIVENAHGQSDQIAVSATVA